MTAREAETARRRRLRCEARERAEREDVLGGPLVDLSGSSYTELFRHHYEIAEESLKLARAFALRCWVVRPEAVRMFEEYKRTLMVTSRWALSRSPTPAIFGLITEATL